MRFDGAAYGINIHDEIEGFLGVPISLAAVYAALNRLERCQFVRAIRTAPIAIQGGRSKRLYQLTSAGRCGLEDEQAQAAHLWQALPARFHRGR